MTSMLASNPPAAGTVRSGLLHPPAAVPRKGRVGPLTLLLALRRNPLECWAEEHFEKPIVKVRLPIGQAVLVHAPDAIRHILRDKADNYRKDRLQRRVLSAGLSDGLLSAEGQRWQAQRRAVAPMFAHRSILSFAPAMMTSAARLAEHWAGLGSGATVDVAAEMTRLALDVLERTIFSDGLGSDPEGFRVEMSAYFKAIGRIGPLDLLCVPNFVPRLAGLDARSPQRFFEAAIDTMIERRRARIAAHPDDAPSDLLTLLLDALDPETGTAMTGAEVRSNILTFISAGHETTANALTWSLLLVSQSPYWRERVEAEVDGAIGSPPEGLAGRLPVTRAVIEEAIRLYPPIAAISRVALGDDVVMGERIARGSLIVIAPYVLHRHRRLWDEPDGFDPNRFLGEARRAINCFAYLPFGAGPRTCIGSAFALQEATLVLATIVSRFRVTLAPGHVVRPVLHVTLRPDDGLPMILGQRQPRRSNSLNGM
jgi:cytochrome P450